MLSAVLETTCNIGYYGTHLSLMPSSLLLGCGALCEIGSSIADHYNKPAFKEFFQKKGVTAFTQAIKIDEKKIPLYMTALLATSIGCKIMYGLEVNLPDAISLFGCCAHLFFNSANKFIFRLTLARAQTQEGAAVNREEIFRNIKLNELVPRDPAPSSAA